MTTQLRTIGPRLGLATENDLIIMIALPFNPEISSLELRIFDHDSFSSRHSPIHSKNEFNKFVFKVKGLAAGKKYCYEFLHGEKAIAIENLDSNELFFHSPNALLNQSVCAVSCNNPFVFQSDKFAPYHMWEKLDATLDRSSTGLIIFGGDQVYNDDIEEKILGTYLDGSTSLARKDKAARALLIENYSKFWNHFSIKRIHAQIPSLMMWDDHDITDGWGGRPESFSGKAFKPEWSSLFDRAKEIFQEYQTACNPVPFTHKASSCFLDIGDKRFYMMDFRSEKNVQLHRLISDEHLQDFFTSFDSLPDYIRHVFIVSPVVPVRIHPTLESMIELMSLGAYAIRESLSTNHADLKAGITKAQIADLGDDISDGLTSSANKPTLLKILGFLAQKVLPFRQVAIITGDIHTGGLSEIIIESDLQRTVIPQIVSSPIGYEPMIVAVKNNTTAEGEFTLLETPELSIVARNVKYISQRNFVLLRTKDKALEIEHHFEDSKYPYFFSSSFLPELDKAKGTSLEKVNPSSTNQQTESVLS